MRRTVEYPVGTEVKRYGESGGSGTIVSIGCSASVVENNEREVEWDCGRREWLYAHQLKPLT